jgi:hypothetical protein
VLFYAAATLAEDAPEPTEEPVAGQVDWDAFEPRRLYRSAPTEGVAFMPGEVVLAAEAGEEPLLTPWAVVTGDGRALLYYVRSGAIRVAQASSLMATFSPLPDPALSTDGGTPLGRPSVVRHPDGRFLMYYVSGPRIALAESVDGLSYEPVADVLVPSAAMDEVALAGPGAVRVSTPVGRELIRLYFESWRTDGSVLVMLAATADGTHFARYDIPVLDREDWRLPAPVFVDERTTLLHLIAPRDFRGREVQALVGTIAPGDAVVR